MLLRLNDIPDEEFKLMHESIMEFLWDYGVLFEDEEASGMLIKKGNSSSADGRVHLKKAFVESMISRIPGNGFIMYGRDEGKALRVAPGCIAFRPSTGAPFVLDRVTGGRREATVKDARELTILVDGLDGYDMAHSVVSPVNTPGGAENILMFVNSHRYSMKPSDITVMTAGEVIAIARIAEAIRGGEAELLSKPLTAVDVAMISPLRCAGEQTKALMECARRGLPVEVLTSPVMGMTSPVTIAGSVMTAMADFFAALCLLYLIRPELGVINTARISPANMRTTAYNYGAPELGIGSVLTASICARYGIPSNLYGFGSNAKRCGGQAELEKMASAIPAALTGGAHMITGGGVLDDALTSSAEQLVIDNESIRYIRRMLRAIEISAESVGLGIIREGIEGSGCLLGEEHTVKYVREGELMHCSLGQWDSYQGWENSGKPDLYELAAKKADEILASHTVEDFSRDVKDKIGKILDEAL